MCKEVLVYSGEGAGARSVQSAVQTLQSTLQLGPPDKPALKVLGCVAMSCMFRCCMCRLGGSPYLPELTQHGILYLAGLRKHVMKVKTLGTADLLAGSWRRRCLMLVMPGGADLPYCRHLDGAGNDLIRGGALLTSDITSPLVGGLA
jgi:glutamine amidotransferase-like uncharacterized protein